MCGASLVSAFVGFQVRSNGRRAGDEADGLSLEAAVSVRDMVGALGEGGGICIPTRGAQLNVYVAHQLR